MKLNLLFIVAVLKRFPVVSLIKLVQKSSIKFTKGFRLVEGQF